MLNSYIELLRTKFVYELASEDALYISHLQEDLNQNLAVILYSKSGLVLCLVDG